MIPFDNLLSNVNGTRMPLLFQVMPVGDIMLYGQEQG